MSSDLIQLSKTFFTKSLTFFFQIRGSTWNLLDFEATCQCQSFGYAKPFGGYSWASPQFVVLTFLSHERAIGRQMLLNVLKGVNGTVGLSKTGKFVESRLG
jgi:hypothetical protein